MSYRQSEDTMCWLTHDVHIQVHPVHIVIKEKNTVHKAS